MYTDLIYSKPIVSNLNELGRKGTQVLNWIGTKNRVRENEWYTGNLSEWTQKQKSIFGKDPSPEPFDVVTLFHCKKKA